MSVSPNISSVHTEDSHAIASSDSTAPVRLSAINSSAPHETWYQVSIRFGARSSCRPTSNASRFLGAGPSAIVRSASIAASGVKPPSRGQRWGALSPPAQCLEDRLEFEAPLRQSVDGHKCRWRQRDLIHHPGLFQLTQPHRQHGRRGPVRAGQEFAEALGTEHQLPDHDHGPAIAHDVEGVGGSASVPMVGVPSANRHGSMFSIVKALDTRCSDLEE